MLFRIFDIFPGEANCRFCPIFGTRFVLGTKIVDFCQEREKGRDNWRECQVEGGWRVVTGRSESRGSGDALPHGPVCERKDKMTKKFLKFLRLGKYCIL